MTDPLVESARGSADPIEQAAALVREYCGWHIAPSRTETLTLNCEGGMVALPSLHVTDVSRVVCAGVDVGDTTWERNGLLFARIAYPFGDYRYGDAATLRDNYALGGTQPVTVTFTHGYDQPPSSIAAIIASLARRLPRVDSVQERAGGVMRIYQPPSTALALTEAMVLDRYRLPLAS